MANVASTSGPACSVDDATKMASTSFSCNAVSCAKKSFFGIAATSKCVVDPTSASCQACGHAACDGLAKSCTGLSTLPPNPSNCGKSTTAVVAMAEVGVVADADSQACSADDATKMASTSFSCNAVSCAKKSFFGITA